MRGDQCQNCNTKLSGVVLRLEGNALLRQRGYTVQAKGVVVTHRGHTFHKEEVHISHRGDTLLRQWG